MRIHFGPGYRAYFTRRGEVVQLLLPGGDKSSQKRDIKRAKEMARTLPKERAMTRFTPFDAADYLDSDEAIAAYPDFRYSRGGNS